MVVRWKVQGARRDGGGAYWTFSSADMVAAVKEECD